MRKQYTLGVDYGTESGRVLLVDMDNGEELAVHVTRYPNGVIDKRLPNSNKQLEPGWALQHPDDYIEVLRKSVPEVLRGSGIEPEQVVGIGIDFTSCTVLPVDERCIPLCYKESLRDEPHAYVKLWKHHSAQDEANRINETAVRLGEAFLSRYGGKASSGWMVAKGWQILNEAPSIYDQMHRLVEASDWIVHQLTGNLVRSSCAAGYKSFWHKEDGYPSSTFYRALDPRLEQMVETKLQGKIAAPGIKAGGLTEEAAALTGLCPGTAVAVGMIDAHAGALGAGAIHAGQMVMSMGTSLCHILLSDKEIPVEGICGVVEDGVVPGLYAYEAGQPAVGDLFGWFIASGVPGYVERAAAAEGVSLHAWLEKGAARLRPGEHGLLALDWWNGNRSVLVDADLSGTIVGMTLGTKPEDIYRCLLEATAFGTRKIIETYEAAGIEVRELIACGGLPQRNRLLMQIYADVTGREIQIAGSAQTSALGSAMLGAAAAVERGGCGSIREAAMRMACSNKESYRPIPEHTAVYDQLYREYNRLHEWFGRGDIGIMRELKRIRSMAEKSKGRRT
ncbi:ribulokinase [Paenibacillus radicis (ex Xue et al. 2023)]|uniref:Ribulokinase n=1 Tax=Paenibacillus radicis (ex Xue et al. 2023) TaxID=2972489 RepID=A0ABT1YTI5_9BACL|nr:ribulokinase [Paenibacillus radicis (ex Xue et al. 2023)]MCR8636502.1 ribulokinase [Paenibacillus radicis (ex Xue et al. 2023)]